MRLLLVKETESGIESKVNEILKKTGLDFIIEKVPLFTTYNHQFIRTNEFGLLNSKSKEVLSTVKGGYHPSQNHDIVRKVVKGTEQFSNLEITHGGALNGGRKVVLQLAVSGSALIGNDIVKRYITILDSNDKSSSLSIGIGDETMSCTNQFFHFYKSKSHATNRFRFRHSKSIEDKMEEIPMLIEFALSESMRMMDLYREFQSTECSRNLAHELVNHLIGIDRTSPKEELEGLSAVKRNKMNSIYDNIFGEMDGNNSRLYDDSQYEAKGENFWGLLSGVTRYTSHNLSVPKRENGRMESQMTGGANTMNHKALEFILEKSGIEFEFEPEMVN